MRSDKERNTGAPGADQYCGPCLKWVDIMSTSLVYMPTTIQGAMYLMPADLYVLSCGHAWVEKKKP